MSTTCRHALDSLSVHLLTADNELHLYCAACNTTFVLTMPCYWSASVHSLKNLRTSLPTQPIDKAHTVVQVTQ